MASHEKANTNHCEFGNGNYIAVIEFNQKHNEMITGYLCRDKKHGWCISNSLVKAQRYKTYEGCDKAISKHLRPSDAHVSVKQLDESELEKIKEQKEIFWNFAFSRASI